MAEPTPPAAPSGSAPPPPPLPPSAASAVTTPPTLKPTQNPALKMMGLPALPRKLPSRNWLIFWTLSGTLTAAIVYDRREKRRATARWAASVAHLATEPLPDPSALPRKLTVYLAAPPGDGLRVAQDHFREYVKPVLAASGLDWDFRQGRQQGDIRAVVAEEVRKRRRRAEGDDDAIDEQDLATTEEYVDRWRKQHGIAEYDGVRGDLVIGRNTWKEYIRGLHEGWLGPLRTPTHAQPDPEPEAVEGEETKPKRPPQPKPYNSVDDYAIAHLPMHMPTELAPSTPLPFPHILGFLNTPTRLYRYLTRRRLADEIGREVAAACLCTYRDYKQLSEREAANSDPQWEQQTALAREESDWVKTVWKSDEDEASTASDDATPTAPDSELVVDGSRTPDAATRTKMEKLWPRPVMLDQRIAVRMRRFELQSEDEQRAREVVVPEEEIEGLIKGSLRSLWHLGASMFKKEDKIPNVGDVE